MKKFKIFLLVLFIVSTCKADQSATIQATATVIQPLGLIEKTENENETNLHLRLARQGNLSIKIEPSNEIDKTFYYQISNDINSTILKKKISSNITEIDKNSLLKNISLQSDSVVITLIYTDQ